MLTIVKAQCNPILSAMAPTGVINNPAIPHPKPIITADIKLALSGASLCPRIIFTGVDDERKNPIRAKNGNPQIEGKFKKASANGTIKIKDIIEKNIEYGIGLGNFDGVHRAHEFLITELVNECRKKNIRSMIFVCLIPAI